MDYSQRNPAKNLSGIALVIILHIIIGYALVSGLARKVVEVIKAPIETKIIEEIKKPPPDAPPPPPPKLATPPPPFIPPPEINIQVPQVTPPPTITTVTRRRPRRARRRSSPRPLPRRSRWSEGSTRLRIASIPCSRARPSAMASAGESWRTSSSRPRGPSPRCASSSRSPPAFSTAK